MESQNGLFRTAAAFFIVGCILLLIYFGSGILFPLILAGLFAVLLRPIVKFLNEKLRIPGVIAIVITLVFAIAIGSAILYFMSYQISEFMNDLPTIKKNIQQNIWRLQSWISGKFGYSISEQKKYVDSTVSDTKVISASSVGSITSSLMYLVLIPVYTFLILHYRSLILGFFLKLVKKDHIENLQVIISEMKSIVRNYIMGLVIQVIIVATLTSLGYWIVGVNYFIFLGVLTALMNLIPYIGIIMASLISCLVALAGSNDPMAIVGVLGVTVIVQLLDNNILMPKIVGSKVSINALTSMVGVIVGGSLAGIAGMFLAIPMIAILKVIFDRVPSLAPYGYLMGDEIPKSFDWNKIRLPLFNSKAKETTTKEEKETTEESNKKDD